MFKRSDGVFVVLRVSSAPKGVFAKRKIRKTVNNACLQSVSTENGLPFYLLDIPEGMPPTVWNTIETKCGRYASRIVAPRTLTLPDCGKIRRFMPSSTPSLLTFNTAVATIKKARIEPESISITLTDINARHAAELDSLLPLASTLRVITARPERYASACEKAFNDCGASVILRSDYEASSKPDIVICCDGRLSPKAENAAVFCHKSKICGKLHIKGSGIELHPHHRNIIPESIDGVDFAGALTELCGCTEYKKSCFDNIETSCGKCGNHSPETCLKCFAEGKL